MSRNFGIRRRHVLPREKLLSNRAEDILLFVAMVIILGSLMLLKMEFPHGMADLKELRIGLVKDR